MQFTTLVGNEALKNQLSQQQKRRGLSHGYLIFGPQGSGKHTLATILVQAMLCKDQSEHTPCGVCSACRKVLAGIHPDVTVVSGEDKAASVEQIRQVRADAYIRPNEGLRKIYLVEKADQLNQFAQNAMLKLLEEGPPYATFLLLAESAGGLLQTVRSRCEELMLTPVSRQQGIEWLCQKKAGIKIEQAADAMEQSYGWLGKAIQLLELQQQETKWTAYEQWHGQARQLAELLCFGDELTLFEETMKLEKQPKEALPQILGLTLQEIGQRLPGMAQKKRGLHAAELIQQMQQALEQNVNPGQIAGWLCAGMFYTK